MSFYGLLAISELRKCNGQFIRKKHLRRERKKTKVVRTDQQSTSNAKKQRAEYHRRIQESCKNHIKCEEREVQR